MTIRASLTRKYSRSHLLPSSASSASFAFVHPVLNVFHAHFFSDRATSLVKNNFATVTPVAQYCAIISHIRRDVGDYNSRGLACMEEMQMISLYASFGPGQFRALASIMEGSLIS
jgi:hypothetical protein